MTKFMKCIVLAACLFAPNLSMAETIGVWPDYRAESGWGHGRDRPGRHRYGDMPMVAPPVIVEPQIGANPRPGWFHDRRRLPSECLRAFDTRYGVQEIYGTPCLQNWPRLAAALPDGCHVRIMTHSGVRDGYDPSCLRGQGYRNRR